jgi:hypothetical protein
MFTIKQSSFVLPKLLCILYVRKYSTEFGGRGLATILAVFGTAGPSVLLHILPVFVY